LSKRKRSAAKAQWHEPVVDYGTGFSRRNARIVPNLRLASSQGMELADVVDVSRPDARSATVRVARRQDPLTTILDIRNREGPDAAHYMAAEELRKHSWLADSSLNYCHPDLFEGVLHVGAHGDPQMPMLSRIDAQKKVRQAWLAVRGSGADGADIADVVRMVVLAWATLQQVERHRHWRHGRSRPLLDAGLSRLAEHYGTWC
jgi:hypothetical protein